MGSENPNPTGSDNVTLPALTNPENISSTNLDQSLSTKDSPTHGEKQIVLEKEQLQTRSKLHYKRKPKPHIKRPGSDMSAGH